MINLKFIKSLCSPFKPFKIKVYLGKTAIGVPYFYPRKWIKSKEKPGYYESIPKKVGFSFCSLGFKTKWSDTDYRFEWSPTLSFVFFGYQLAFIASAPHRDQYWESWLYYENNTDKSKSRRERINQCIEEFPLTYESYFPDGRKETTDYYKLILRPKYL